MGNSQCPVRSIGFQSKILNTKLLLPAARAEVHSIDNSAIENSQFERQDKQRDGYNLGYV
jgi:hypothetical protein